MQGNRGQTKFTTVGNPTVTNSLHTFPSHPVACLAWGKRKEILQRLEFFETVFLLLHYRDMACSYRNIYKQPHHLFRVYYPNGQTFPS